jgi:hypothetical protein
MNLATGHRLFQVRHRQRAEDFQAFLRQVHLCRLAAQQMQDHFLFPSGRPAPGFGATPPTSFSFRISNPFSLTRFYPKFVSR